MGLGNLIKQTRPLEISSQAMRFIFIEFYRTAIIENKIFFRNFVRYPYL